MKEGIKYSLKLLGYKIDYLESCNGRIECIKILREFQDQLINCLVRLKETGDPNSYSYVMDIMKQTACNTLKVCTPEELLSIDKDESQ